MVQVPPQIQIFGDEALGREFIGRAKIQMDILRNQMKFQKLNQGVRKVRLADNVFIECFKIYNTEVCKIIAIRERLVSEVIIVFSTHLLIVFGNAEQTLTLTNVKGVFEPNESIYGGSCSGDITSVTGVDELTQTIYGTFTDCITTGVTITGSNSGASGIIDTLLDRYFQKAYEYYEFLEDPTLLTTKSNEYEIISALDTFPPSSIPNGFNITIDQEWSKTLNKFMVSAFTHYSEHKYEMNWTVSASYNGKILTWNGESEYFGNFKRTILKDTVLNIEDASYEDAIKTHIGFDLWQDDDNNYFVGIISDQEETLYVFKYDTENNTLVLQNNYPSLVRKNYYTYHYQTNYVDAEVFYTIENSYNYVRLLGFGYVDGQYMAYWSDINRGNIYYYEENLLTTEIIQHQIIDDTTDDNVFILSALWNPLKNELYVLSDPSFNIPVIDTEYSFTQEFDHLVYDDVLYPDDYTGEPLDLTTENITGFLVVPYSRYIDYPMYYYYVEDYPYVQEILSTIWKGDYTGPWFNYNRGTFLVGSDDYFKGTSKKRVLNGTNETYLNVFPGTDYVANTYFDTGKVAIASPSVPIECITYEAYKYELNKWIFIPTEKNHSYEYQKTQILPADPWYKDYTFTLEDPACEEGSTEIKTEGNATILNAASDEFPYDFGWTAILLKGTDHEDNTYENWVIYKDLVGDEGYFAVSDNNNIYPIGSYDRAFFYNFTQQDED